MCVCLPLLAVAVKSAGEAEGVGDGKTGQGKVGDGWIKSRKETGLVAEVAAKS